VFLEVVAYESYIEWEKTRFLKLSQQGFYVLYHSRFEQDLGVRSFEHVAFEQTSYGTPAGAFCDPPIQTKL
jgi:hypothetical protein